MADSAPMATAPQPVTLLDLHTLAQTLRQRRAELAALVTDLDRRVAAVVQKLQPQLDQATLAATVAHEALQAAIAGNPGLFTKPRTHLLAGFKLGLEKGKGGLVIADEERTLTLIRKRFKGHDADLYIHTAYRPNRETLGRLPAKDLAGLGVELSQTGDRVVVRDTESDQARVIEKVMPASKPAKAQAPAGGAA